VSVDLFSPALRVQRNFGMVKNLFLVEDDADDREMFSKAIKLIDPSINLTYASNGQEALKLLEVSPTPDLIFLDYNMPKMDGVECLTKLKSNRKTKPIPIVIYTGTKDEQESRLLQKLGACFCLIKVHNIDKLCFGLKQVFENYSTRCK
jgi:CheY-like chemotaxis protein